MQQQYYMSIAGGYLYMGDMQEGDRKATQAEVEAYMVQTNKIAQKQEIAQQLSTLTVITSANHVFDATSQARQDMSDAILASGVIGATQTVWRMADNSEVLIDLTELKEAHALAIQEYARIKGIGA